MIKSGIKKINGVDVSHFNMVKYQPDVNTQSTEDSGRDLGGYMYNVFLPFKVKLECVWPPHTLSQRAILLSAIKTSGNPSNMSIEFLNPDTGGWSTKTFMLGTPQSQELLNTLLEDGMWDELSINFIEK